MRCLIYVRVSTARQEAEGYSLEAQLQLCRDYASRLGASVVREFVEVESASSLGRPQFAALLGELDRDPSLAVVAQSTDRLHRNMEDAAALERTGAAVHLVHEGGVAASGSMGRFTGRLKATLAALYAERLGEEATKGMTAKAAAGYWPTVAPIGYRNTSAHGRKIIEPCPTTSALVRELFIRCAGGSTIDDLTAWARSVGLRKLGSVTTLSRARIGAILAHPVYSGMVPWKGELYPGQHEPLVSPKEWQAARDAITGRRRSRTGKAKRNHAYGSGLLRCACCGSAIVGETKRQRHGRVYIYYRSTGRKGQGCPRKYTSEANLERGVRERFAEFRMTDEDADDLRCLVGERIKEAGGSLKQHRARLRANIQTLEERIQRSLTAYVDGLTDAASHQAAAGKWRGEIAAAEAELASLAGESRIDEETAMGLIEVARGSADIISDLSPAARRELMRFYGAAWLLEPKAGSVRVEWAPIWGALARTPEARLGGGSAGDSLLVVLDGSPGGTASRTYDPLLIGVPGEWYHEARGLLERAA